VHHVHTKMLDGFLGQLPVTWLEQIQLTVMAPSTGKATFTTYNSEKAREAHIQVTNTNYINALKKR
jgi:hypothetical protein